MIQKGNVHLIKSGVVRGNREVIPRENNWCVTVIVPEYVSSEQVLTSWTSAVRYTADALDKPNYEKALQRMSEYHPSWTFVRSAVTNVIANLENSLDDQPDKP